MLSVCQSIATTVLDLQQHNNQQLWTELWERVDDEPVKKTTPVEKVPDEGLVWEAALRELVESMQKFV